MFLLELTLWEHAAADALSSTEKNGGVKIDNNKSQTSPGIEDLFNDAPSITPSSATAKPQKDVKNDIMSLFEKVCFLTEKYEPIPA